MPTSLLSTFATREDAEAAIAALNRAGVDSADISAIYRNHPQLDPHRKIRPSDNSELISGVITGAITGGILGGLIGYLLSLGLFATTSSNAATNSQTGAVIAGIVLGAALAALLGGIGTLSIHNEPESSGDPDESAAVIRVLANKLSTRDITTVLRMHHATSVRAITAEQGSADASSGAQPQEDIHE